MAHIHTIKLKDLDADYIKKLKEKHLNPNQEIAIWMRQKSTAMPEDEFWYIISLLRKNNHNVLTLEPAIDYLSQLTIEKIQAFEDILSEQLYLLDGQVYAEHSGDNAYQGDGQPFSADSFLYARCYAVALGKQAFQQIVKYPNQMPKNQTFEPLLNLASTAYQQKTGQIFEYIPAFIYETFANLNGWQGENFLSKLLNHE